MPPLLDKLDDRGQFVGVKPYTMLFTNIDDHARDTGKIIAVHQSPQVGARHIIDLRHTLAVKRTLGHKAKNRGLTFAVRTNIFKRPDADPEPVAMCAAAT